MIESKERYLVSRIGQNLCVGPFSPPPWFGSEWKEEGSYLLSPDLPDPQEGTGSPEILSITHIRSS